MIIEDHPAIGTPVHCGECISEIACENLNLDLPEHVISLRVHGIRVIFPDGTEKCLTEEGYVLEKHLFERWIAEEAVSAGASLHLRHKLHSMERVLQHLLYQFLILQQVRQSQLVRQQISTT